MLNLAFQTLDLRPRRRVAGLTIRQVARAAGTNETNVAAYERGDKTPNQHTLARLSAAIDCGADSPIHTARLTTVPATAAALRAGLRQDWPLADLLRIVRQMVSDTRHLRTAQDRAAFFARPSTTGDRRWDTLLAGVVEHLIITTDDEIEVPGWTVVKPLPAFWFASEIESLHAWAFAHTPISLQARGVILDSDVLASV